MATPHPPNYTSSQENKTLFLNWYLLGFSQHSLQCFSWGQSVVKIPIHPTSKRPILVWALLTILKAYYCRMQEIIQFRFNTFSVRILGWNERSYSPFLSAFWWQNRHSTPRLTVICSAKPRLQPLPSLNSHGLFRTCLCHNLSIAALASLYIFHLFTSIFPTLLWIPWRKD